VALTVGSLFSGIGGIDLGLERAGMVTRWFCEIDPHCRNVLVSHHPQPD
jgi:DNA (cytosine-5)-methyltransferase 1